MDIILYSMDSEGYMWELGDRLSDGLVAYPAVAEQQARAYALEAGIKVLGVKERYIPRELFKAFYMAHGRI